MERKPLTTLIDDDPDKLYVYGDNTKGMGVCTKGGAVLIRPKRLFQGFTRVGKNLFVFVTPNSTYGLYCTESAKRLTCGASTWSLMNEVSCVALAFKDMLVILADLCTNKASYIPRPISASSGSYQAYYQRDGLPTLKVHWWGQGSLGIRDAANDEDWLFHAIANGDPMTPY